MENSWHKKNKVLQKINRDKMNEEKRKRKEVDT